MGLFVNSFKFLELFKCMDVLVKFLYFSGGKNKGFKMLEKMGWEGGGLGRSKDGIQEPIQVQQRANKSGLGTDIPVEASIQI